MNEKKKKRSLTKRIMLLAAALVFLFLLTSVITIMSLIRSMINNSYASSSETLSYLTNQMSDDLKEAETLLINYTTSNADTVKLITAKEPQNTYHTQTKVKRLISTALSNLHSIEGLYIYAPHTDVFVSSGLYNMNPADGQIRMTMRKVFQNYTETDLNTIDWYPVMLDGTIYFFRNIRTQHGVVGAWTSADTLLKAVHVGQFQDNIIFFSDSTGKPVDTNCRYGDDLNAAGNVTRESVIRIDGERYLLLTGHPSFTACRLILLIPIKEILGTVWSAIGSAVIAFLCVAALLCTLFLFVNRMYSQPLRALHQAAGMIVPENPNGPVLNNNSRWLEIREINSAINSLVDQVRRLNTQIWAEQISRKDLELQYMRSQVPPHFLINCFRLITSMQESGEDPKLINEVVATLSEHLRYTLRPSNRVSLQEELYYVDNFLHFNALRFPGCLTWEIHCENACRDIAVFPVLILMLTENSVKHNLTMGEKLTVSIDCFTENKRFVHIVHRDTGKGYPAEVPEILNSMRDMKENPTLDGRRIGLYNIVRRFSLMYGQEGSVRFSNGEDGGARVDIVIPGISFIEPKEKV